MMAELLALRPQPRRPGGVTIGEFAEANRCAEATARRFLHKQEKQGKLAAVWSVMETGRTGWVFYASPSPHP